MPCFCDFVENHNTGQLHSKCTGTHIYEHLPDLKADLNAEYLTRHGLLSIHLPKSRGKVMYLFCGKQIALFNDSNLNRL